VGVVVEWLTPKVLKGIDGGGGRDTETMKLERGLLVAAYILSWGIKKIERAGGLKRKNCAVCEDSRIWGEGIRGNRG